MNRDDFDKLLAETLEDYRLSRSEKKLLTVHIDPEKLDDHELAHLRSRVFDVARHEVPGPQAFAVLNWLEDVLKALQPKSESASVPNSAAYFSPGDDCAEKICGLLKTARQQIDVCVFTITDNRVARALLDAHDNKRKIRIITDDDKSNDLGSDIDRLRDAGIAIRADRSPYHMHHKFALFDNTKLLTGSYNWTRSADTKNEENFIVTDDRGLVKRFRNEFDQLWKQLG